MATSLQSCSLSFHTSQILRLTIYPPHLHRSKRPVPIPSFAKPLDKSPKTSSSSASEPDTPSPSRIRLRPPNPHPYKNNISSHARSPCHHREPHLIQIPIIRLLSHSYRTTFPHLFSQRKRQSNQPLKPSSRSSPVSKP